MGATESGSIGGLAKRWLKNQLQVHGDPRRAYRERQESEAIEAEIEERAREQAGRSLFNALAPAGLKEKLAGLERANQEQARLREEQRRQEHRTRPRADVHLRLSGDVTGALSGAMPIVLNHPQEVGEALAVELSPLTDATIGGRPLRALLFAIPGYAGAGHYDLLALAHANDMADWDPYWFQLILDSEDEPFYWVPDYGRGVVTVEPDERAMAVILPMRNAGGERVLINATITLP